MVPLYNVGPYELYPLHVCSEDAIATLFASICARGNPILKGKPAEDLHRLGVGFYKKSVGCIGSTVFLLNGTEPVALMFTWDTADGGVWKDTTPPASLHCHAAIGAAVFGSRAQTVTQPKEQMFMAFVGVALPHPGHALLMPLEYYSMCAGLSAGYTNTFGYGVHPKTMEQIKSWPSEPEGRDQWQFAYSDIQTEDAAVREELLSISPGIAECAVTGSVRSMEYTLEVATPENLQILDGLRLGVARMVASPNLLRDAQAVTSPEMAPLYNVGPYALYPLHVCSEDAAASLFTKICARGNPILQGKPAEDLYRLGAAFYKKSVGCIGSTVFLLGTEPVALLFAWDTADGGVWKDIPPPESLHCHAAIGAAVFGSRPQTQTQPKEQIFMAFSGVTLPHPGHALLLPMEFFVIDAAKSAGFKNTFGYGVHPKTIAQVKGWPGEPGFREQWDFSYSGIKSEDPMVREELLSISPGEAACCVTDLVWCMEKTHDEATPELSELLEGLRPGVARMVASPNLLRDVQAVTLPKMAPLYVFGPYALYPLHVCSEDAAATLFTKICERGNPILKKKPAEDLYRLGVAFYNKAVGCVGSTVFLHGTEPVGLLFGWDTADGGVWKDISPPESLRCHAAIRASVFGSRPQTETQPKEQIFIAFSGVALPHPGRALLLPMEYFLLDVANSAGFKNIFGYGDHDKIIEQIQAWPVEPGVRDLWQFTYSDIQAEDAVFREELLSINPGFAQCVVTDLPWCMAKLEREAPPEEFDLLEGLRPGVARMAASQTLLRDEVLHVLRARL